MSKPFKSLQGQLLLDGGSLAGSFFSRTVVLVCQHNPEGAFGLVLNRRADQTVGEVVIEDLPERIAEQDLWVGGPVQGTVMSFLHTDDFLPGANVMPFLHHSNSVDDLLEIANSFSISSKVRIFAGYSGWGAGQLDDEMRRKAWITQPAAVSHVFETEPDNLWRSVMTELGGVHRLMADGPEDLSWN